ncbi:MAG: carboxymuconolactone decarboxylase family protein [Acidimicrobiales bacterium]
MRRAWSIGSLVGDAPPFDRGYGRLLRGITFAELDERDCVLAALHTASRSGYQPARRHLGAAEPAPSRHDAALLAAVDEPHDERFLSDEAWNTLDLTPGQTVELCFLVGLLELIAMTTATFDRDSVPSEPTPISSRSLADPRWKLPSQPRLPAPDVSEIGIRTWAASRAIGLANGAGSVDGIELFSRSPRLFWSVVPFLLRLGPLRLGRANGEIVTLRATWNVGSHYHWGHHGFAGRLAGLSTEQIERVADGPDWPGWTDEQAALLRAVDDLHQHRRIGDTCWDQLHELFDDSQIAEICLVTGNYEMLCMALNSFGVRFEDDAWDRGVTRHLLRLRRDRRR